MNVLVYANVNLDLIDGSTIWVESIVEVLSSLLDCNVTVLSQDRLSGRGVVPALKRMKSVRIACYPDFADIFSGPGGLGDEPGMAKAIDRLHAEYGFDRIIVRDLATALAVAREASLGSRLWAYVLDSPSLLADADRSLMGELAELAGGILVQSDTQRGLLEAVFPAACGKTSILPPMVKPVRIENASQSRHEPAAPVRFIYSGKYSIIWNVEAYFDIPKVCKSAGVPATVTMIGDKIHNEKSDPEFRRRILSKLSGTPGVTWLGGIEREDAIRASAENDLGLCWRTDALDDSLEISTKFLEFATVGVPSVVNRTAAYEALLGADYPYFAETMADLVASAKAVTADPEAHERVRQRCRTLGRAFTYEAAAERLRQGLRLRPRTKWQPGKASPPLKLLVASHDLKFLNLALRALADDRNVEILRDTWASTSTHDERLSTSLLEQADVIFCEWCTGPAVWYSQRKAPHQKLIIRLHRFEANTNFPAQVRADAVDAVIVVSEHFRDLCAKKYGWDASKITVLPQYCAADQLRRSKHPGAEKTLGFVGINGFHHKRFDRAIDVLRLVRHRDPAFRMRIRSAMPWEYGWIWKDNQDEVRQFSDVFARLEGEPELRNAIIFDRPGPNMAEWYRHIGFILSTSESEGCHTSVAEGICSGASPIVIDWPGARSIYGAANVFESVDQMADAILNASASGAPDVARLQELGRRDFDIARTVDHLEHVLWGVENATRQYA